MATKPKQRKTFPVVLILDTLANLTTLTARVPGRAWNPPYPWGTKVFVEEDGLFYNLDKEGNASLSDKEGGHAIETDGVSVPNRPTLNFVGSNFLVTDTGTKTQIQVIPDVKYLQAVTHADLLTLVGSSTLEPGMNYAITDFATRHIIPNSGGTINTGTTETLVVTAIALDKLDYRAKSLSYPKDIIHYELIDSSTAGGDKGRITFRKDPAINVSTHYDWRNVKFRRYRNAQSLSLVVGGSSLNILGAKITGGTSGAIGYVIGGFGANTLRLVNHTGLFINGEIVTSDSGASRTINVASDYSIGTDYYDNTGRASSDVYTFVDSAATGIENINIGTVGSSGPSDLLNNITFSTGSKQVYLGDGCFDCALNVAVNMTSKGDFYENYFVIGATNNTFSKGAYANKIYGGFDGNECAGLFLSNVIAYGFTNNSLVGYYFGLNTIARNFSYNSVLIRFASNTFDTPDAKFNNFESDVQGQTFLNTAITITNTTGTKRVFKGTDGIFYVETFNGVTMQYADPLTA